MRNEKRRKKKRNLKPSSFIGNLLRLQFREAGAPRTFAPTKKKHFFQQMRIAKLFFICIVNAWKYGSEPKYRWLSYHFICDVFNSNWLHHTQHTIFIPLFSCVLKLTYDSHSNKIMARQNRNAWKIISNLVELPLTVNESLYILIWILLSFSSSFLLTIE